jgi:hypothetical protein
MEVWNGHLILLHRFIKSSRIAVRFIANGHNTGSPRRTKFKVKGFQIDAGFNKLKKIELESSMKGAPKFSFGTCKRNESKVAEE